MKGSNEKRMLERQMQGEGRENIDWMIYDSLLTTAGATQQLIFFQNALGTVGKVRTNMQQAGQLPNPKTMFVTEIACKIVNLTGAPVFFSGGAAPTIHPFNVIFNSMFFEVRLDPATLYEGHGIDFFDQINYMNDTAAVLGVSTSPTNNTLRSIKLKKPIIIPSTRSFSLVAQITTPAAAQGYLAANTAIYFQLKGVMRRNS
jgi:hypothetical protein